MAAGRSRQLRDGITYQSARKADRSIPDILPPGIQPKRARRRRIGVTNQETSPLRSVRHCCRHPIPDTNVNVDVYVRHQLEGEASVRFGGVVQCRNPRVCFHCSPWLARERAATVDAIASAHDREAGSCTPMLTLTVPHALGDNYEAAWRAVGEATSAMMTHRTWKELKRLYRVTGHIRAMETTHGPNGFHPHCHVLLLFGVRPTREQLEEIRACLYRLWVDAVAEAGIPGVPSERYGLDFRIFEGEERAAYISKMSLGLEMARPDTKEGDRSGYRTMAQVVADMHDGDGEAAKVWYAYSVGQRWQRHLTFSRGLKRRYQTDIELALAAAVEDPKIERIEEFQVDKVHWYRYVSRCPAMLCMVVEAAKTDGEAGVWGLFALAEQLAKDHESYHLTENLGFRVLQAVARGVAAERGRQRREGCDGELLSSPTVGSCAGAKPPPA